MCACERIPPTQGTQWEWGSFWTLLLCMPVRECTLTPFYSNNRQTEQGNGPSTEYTAEKFL